MQSTAIKTSTKWVQWWTQLDLFVCGLCFYRHKKIFRMEEYPCPAHPNCRCVTLPLQVISAGHATKDGMNGAEKTLIQTGRLPDYYITKHDAVKLGWKSLRGNLSEVAPGRTIGGDPYRNHEKILPDANGRLWYEADINYTGGYRGADRLFYSNDGLIFVSYDHGNTFFEIN